LHESVFFRERLRGRTLASMRTATEAKWVQRVSAWRASGQEAGVFVAGKGYEASTLRWWASRLGRAESPRIVPLVARGSALRDTGRSAVEAVVVEVGAARVRVTRGFDGELLADVVRALSARGQQ